MASQLVRAVKQSFVTVGYSRADFPITGASDHTVVSNAISFANSNNIKEVRLKGGDYDIREKIQAANDVRIVADGDVNFNVSSTISGGTHRGAIEVTDKVNVVIDGINFNVSTNNTAILATSYSNLTIRNCTFTGDTAGQSMITLGTYTSGGTWQQAKIENCRFIDCPNTYGIFLHTFSGRGPIEKVVVKNCYFEGVKYAAVKFTAVDGMIRNVKILHNDFYDILGDLTGQTNFGAAVWGGLDTAYQVEDVLIENNYYENNLSGRKKGFVLFYSSKDVKIIGNAAIDNSSDTGGCIFMAPGRLDAPLIGLQIKDNWVEGWQAFWDPDSMTFSEISGNVIKDCLNTIGIGYGVQEYVNVHDNLVYNSILTSIPAAMIMGTVTSCKKCKVHDNTFVDDRETPLMLYAIETAGNGEYDTSDVEIYDNRIYVPNAPLTSVLHKQFSNNIPPRSIHGNEIHDSTGVFINGYTTKTSAYTVTTADEIINCTSGTFTVTLMAAASVPIGKKITVKNSGAGTITVDGDGSETIDGGATDTLAAGVSGRYVSTGTAWIKV